MILNELVSTDEVLNKMETKLTLILRNIKRQWKFLHHIMKIDGLENLTLKG